MQPYHTAPSFKIVRSEQGVNDFLYTVFLSRPEASCSASQGLAWWSDQRDVSDISMKTLQQIPHDIVCTRSTTAASQQTAELIPGTEKADHFPQ